MKVIDPKEQHAGRVKPAVTPDPEAVTPEAEPISAAEAAKTVEKPPKPPLRNGDCMVKIIDRKATEEEPEAWHQCANPGRWEREPGFFTCSTHKRSHKVLHRVDELRETPLWDSLLEAKAS